MSNELTCVSGDWQALAWSIGGLSVLFKIDPKPLHTAADLDEVARKHARRRLHAINNGWIAENLGLFVLVISCLAPALGIVMGKDVLGNGTLIVGYLFLTPLIYLRTREPDVPDRDDRADLVRFYVEDLSARSRNLISFWMFLAGGLMVTYGWHFEAARGVAGTALIKCTSSLLLALFLAQHASNRKRYAQVRSLLDIPLRD